MVKAVKVTASSADYNSNGFIALSNLTDKNSLKDSLTNNDYHSSWGMPVVKTLAIYPIAEYLEQLAIRDSIDTRRFES